MLFNSIEFPIFFLAVAVGYFALPFRFRWVLLLVASYAFYMAWRPEFGLLMFVATFINYAAALGMSGTRARRRVALAAALIASFAILFTFKYFNFFVDSAAVLLRALGLDYIIPQASLLLPVGISFFTFQSVGYTIDVYRRDQQPETNLARLALFIAYFPQLVAGPIERAGNLIPQLRANHRFEYERVRSGLILMLWGFFKKMIIADRLAVVVNFVYTNPERHPGSFLALATVFFAFQIYCDFSGYTDIARGCSRILGIELMKNFNRPYVARSIAEFWRRWHISLTTWFRDYLYYPLGGNRVDRGRWMLNISVVFLVSGLWHGAAWTFVIWGALHAVFYLLEWALRLLAAHLRPPFKSRSRLRNMAATVVTFALVCFAWIFFRAESLADALYIIERLPGGWVDLAPYGGWREIVYSMNISPMALALSGILIAVLLLSEWVFGDQEIDGWVVRRPALTRWAVYAALTLAILNMGALEEMPFVYYQF